MNDCVGAAMDRTVRENVTVNTPAGSDSLPAASPTRRASAVAVPFLGILGAVQGSSPNIASSALVHASRGLHMAADEVALAASVQTLAIAASVISTGLLADRLGRRRVLMAALGVGAAGGVIVAASPSTVVYLLGQVLLGVGLGAVYGAAFAYIRAVAAPGRLAGAVGVFAATIGLTTLILTFAGGSLVAVNWRFAYLVVPVMSVICLLLVPAILPREDRIRSTKQDVVGQVLLALGIIGFLYGVSELGHSLTSPRTLGPLGLGTLLIAAFFVFEARNPNRFFPVGLFRSPVFVAAVLAGFIYNFGTAVSFLQATNLWQYVTGLTSSEVAIWQIPLVGAGVIGALVVGRLMTRGLTNRAALIIGAILTAIGFVGLAVVHASTSFLVFAGPLILVGAGVVICSIPFGNLFIKEAPPAQFGPVTSSRTTVGQFFYSIGFAVSTVVIDRLTMGGVVEKLTAAGVPATQTGTAVSAVTMYASDDTEPSTALARRALADAVQSYGDAFATMMIVAAVLSIVAGVVAYLLLRRGGEGSKDPRAATAPISPAAA